MVLRGDGGGASGGLSGEEASRHDADGGGHGLVGGDAASRCEDVDGAFGEEGAVGDAVAFAVAVAEIAEEVPLEALEFLHGIIQGVNVHRVCETADFILEGGAVPEVLQGHAVFAQNTPAFADSQLGSGDRQLRILEAGNVFAVECLIFLNPLPQFQPAPGLGGVVVGPQGEGVGEVAAGAAGAHMEHAGVMIVVYGEEEDAYIIRMVEKKGKSVDASVKFFAPLTYAAECDLIERNDEPVAYEGDSISFHATPFEIKNFKVEEL